MICQVTCVQLLVATGFYEWKAADSKKGGAKQPYLVYAAQDEGRPDVLAMSECTAENSYSEQNGWVGPKPLFLAGIFSIWHKPEVRMGNCSNPRGALPGKRVSIRKFGHRSKKWR